MEKLKNQAIDVILQNIMKLKIKRVGEDTNENASIKDLEQVLNNASKKNLLDIISKKKTYIKEDWDYFICVQFTK